jgi:hypothetical protein
MVVQQVLLLAVAGCGKLLHEAAAAVAAAVEADLIAA